ncbi:Ig-like domain-containing protein [Actinoplanes missouriensis]|uniref:Ig-like domain-containing protein n=1 Tax=Actinoplanes missouriensis TaxID=1866 RepID=UPI0033F4B893
MSKLRAAIVAVVSTSLILTAGATPARADDPKPSVISTGLTDGQLLGQRNTFTPIVSPDTDIIMVLVDGVVQYGRPAKQVAESGFFFAPKAAWNGLDVELGLRAYDLERNHSEDVTTRVHIDTEAPTLTFLPSAYTKLNGAATIEFADVPADVARIKLTARSDFEVTSAPWKITWDTRAFVNQTLKPQITVTDRAGNVTYYERYYRFDNAAPEIMSSGIPGVVPPGRSELFVNVTDMTSAELEWWVDGVRRGGDLTRFTYDFGTRSRTAQVTVKARDRFGNSSSVTEKVLVDATKPTVLSVVPANGKLVRGSKITTTVRATDVSGVWADIDGRYDENPAPFTATISAGRDGKRTLTWVVQDGVQNVTRVSRTVIVDNTKASLTVTRAPKNKAKVKGTVKITAAASDRNGVAKVQLLVNGKVVATDAKAAYTFSLNTKKYGKKIKVQLRAYDRAGNVTKTSTRTWYRR